VHDVRRLGLRVWSARELAQRLTLVDCVVEVIPTDTGSADVTALVAERTVCRSSAAWALRRREELAAGDDQSPIVAWKRGVTISMFDRS